MIKSKQIPVKFQVCESKNVDNELNLKLIVADSISENIIPYKCILRNFWANSCIEEGDFINIFEPKLELPADENDFTTTLIVDNEKGLLVLKPDVLLPITTLMSATFCMRRAWLSRMFEIYGEPIKALLLGTLIHELFQICIKKNLFTKIEIENILVDEVLKNFTLELYDLNMNQQNLMNDVRPYIAPISNWFQLYTNKNPDPTALFAIQRLHQIEDCIWSTKYGFIGKIDLTLEAKFEDKLNNTKTFILVPLELKTGKHSFSSSHIGQLILYSFIMSDKYSHYKPSGGFLIYLKDNAHTEHIKTNHNAFRDLMILRNTFIPYYYRRGFIDETNRDELLQGPKMIDSERICSKCEHNLDCSLINRCFESESNNFANETTSHLRANELEFFTKMISLLEIEKLHNLTSTDSAFYWNYRSEQCEMSGMGLAKMKIKYQDNQTIVFIRSPRVSMPKKLFGLNSELSLNLSLLEQRSVVISEEMVNSTKTFEIYGNFCKQLCTTTGFVDSFSPDLMEITINLEKTHLSLLNPNAIYRIDFLNNISTKAMLVNFSNVLRLMTNDPKAAELREIVIHGRIPKFNLNDCNVSSFSKIINSPILAKLNIQQKRCILGVLRTKCSLIFGSPGSGKTQTIVALIQILVEMNCSVLVTSYTHVAVDNILLKLIKANVENGKNVDFLRLGSIKRIHPNLHDYSDYSRTKDWLQNGDISNLANFYSNIPIVASTCLGIANHPLFNKRIFDFCIIDEASQVFLSTSLGPLFHCHNFILVGDQKQLPPVTQSQYARKNGLDECLFTRLLKMAGQNDLSHYDDLTTEFESFENIKINNNNINLKSIRIFPLFIQYRMNSVIMDVSNRITYSGKLKCANQEVEIISLMDYFSDSKMNILNEYKESYLYQVISPYLQDSVVFIDTCSIGNAVETKINEGFSQSSNISSQSSNKTLQMSFVQNEFEAKLIVIIINTMFLIYGLELKDIGIISPFRRQVLQIKELFGKEFLDEHHLEINTVDSYQGRDKDLIIYSCVKSSAKQELDENSPTSFIVDSELLKDERRLNVAITRAKRKLIIIGNRATLNNYYPFKNLFSVLKPEQFIELVNHDYTNIIG